MIEALHETELTRGFFIGETEVTQAQFIAYAGYDPIVYNAGCDDCPVQEVSWDESAAFTNAMSDAHGLERCYDCEGEGLEAWCQASMNPYDCQGYRMPTEAEWEYAASGGENFEYPASDNLDEVGWWQDNSGMAHHSVALLAPNGFGIYDMAGNVSEFVNDWYADHPGGFQVDPWLGRGDAEPNTRAREPLARAVEKGGSFACVASAPTSVSPHAPEWRQDGWGRLVGPGHARGLPNRTHSGAVKTAWVGGRHHSALSGMSEIC